MNKTKTRKNKKNKKNKTLKINKPHYLTVSDIHKIAYYTYGNNKNEPVFVIHGGPGGKSQIKMKNLFNLKKYFVVFIDQRGCGKSKPFGELKDNNTSNLIHDIERIRRHLNLNKINIVGFSWGSYLSLSYSIKYPKNIKKIIVGGVYLCKKEEYNDF